MEFLKQNKILWITLVVIFLVSLKIKWIMIHYGIPYQVHVDEATVLKNPFKLAIMFTKGNFEQTTNLYNWIILFYFSVIFLFGWIGGQWDSVSAFEEFLISDSPDIFIWGRILSLILSVLASILLVRLIFKITPNNWLRILFTLIVVFNPIELNSVNWIKYEAPAYLAYAIVIYFAYEYFIVRKPGIGSVFYILLFIGVAVRIELISFLVGFTVVDFWSNRQQFTSWIKTLVKPVTIGFISFCAITLYPLKWVYQIMQTSKQDILVTSKTYESAIVSDFSIDGVIYGVLHSDYYLYCITALLSPLVLIILILAVRKRALLFLVVPFFIMIFVLIIFPIKNTHYLLNVSVLLLVITILFIASLSSLKWKYILSSIIALWVVSYTLEQAALLDRVKDVRLAARTYLLNNTLPTDTIYVDGIFSQIFDKPARYKIKSEAAKLVGSTGLSNDYYSAHLKDEDTRTIITVNDYEPFVNTPFHNVFNNKYEIDILLQQSPKYYVFVSTTSDFQRSDLYDSFYKQLALVYSKEKEFTYNLYDPRLRFANIYYFKNVGIYSRTAK